MPQAATELAATIHEPEREESMRRRLAAAIAALTIAGVATGVTPSEALAEKATVSCSDYCGEKAAANCEDLESWRCNLYIAGCLAGCNVKKYL